MFGDVAQSSAIGYQGEREGVEDEQEATVIDDSGEFMRGKMAAAT